MKVFRNVSEEQSVNVPTAKFQKSACPSCFSKALKFQVLTVLEIQIQFQLC